MSWKCQIFLLISEQIESDFHHIFQSDADIWDVSAVREVFEDHQARV